VETEDLGVHGSRTHATVDDRRVGAHAGPPDLDVQPDGLPHVGMESAADGPADPWTGERSGVDQQGLPAPPQAHRPGNGGSELALGLLGAQAAHVEPRHPHSSGHRAVRLVAATVMAQAQDGRPACDAVDLQPGTTLIAPHCGIGQPSEHSVDSTDRQFAAGEEKLQARDVPAAHPAPDRAAAQTVTSKGAERSPRLASRDAVDDEAFASLEAAHGGARVSGPKMPSMAPL
jgi:hypothetical protein